MKGTISLREARRESGMTAAEVAAAAGLDRGTLHRIETGRQLPKRANARRLFELFKGRVPLAHIYDPEFASEIAAA
ncbi:MAG: helix-turn-helix transcriptional regulator [Hyphomicrobiaceae bacterium]|nr:helix-turn-helix transcriptional regulator [Hyphomicrobiaceae bacterium]